MTPYKLLLEGDKKTLKEYMERAENDRLDVILFTDQEVDVKTIIKVSTGQYPPEFSNLPDHLRKTACTVFDIGRANADEVAVRTKRARAVESSYLNQLFRTGYIKKERTGRTAYFYVEK